MLWAAPAVIAAPEIALDAPYVAVPAVPFAREVHVADFDADGGDDLLFIADSGFQVALRSGPFRYARATEVAVPQAFAAAVADLNQDGRADVVVTRTTNRVRVFLGVGDGTFRAGAELATDVTPHAVRIARCDADAIPDLVIANFGAQDVSVFRGRGDGTFDAREDWPVPGYPAAIDVADLNGDGIADLVAALRGTGTLAYLLRDGGGLLSGASTTAATLRDPRGLVVRDMDDDGRPDVFVLGTRSSVFDRFWNQGGTFRRSPGSLTPFTQWVLQDVTGDGRPDLVCAVPDRAEVAVLRGTAAGDFVRTPGGVPPAAVNALAVIDGDGDGRADLVATTGGAGPAALLRGAGDGSFGVRRDLEVGRPETMTAADLNGDGRLDLAACSASTPELVAFLATANGEYTEQRSALPDTPTALLIRDFDGDARPDAAISLARSRVGVLRGLGGGAFAPAAEIAVGPEPMGLTAFDVTGDRLLDLTVACGGSGAAMVLQGLGGTQFVNASRPSFVARGLPAGVALGSLNGDNKVDLAVANEGANTITILLGLGDGAFHPTIDVPAGGAPRGVVIADLNQDRDADLAIPNEAAGTVTLVMGDPAGLYTDRRTLQGFDRPKEVLPADLNADGKADLVVVHQGGVAVFVQVARGFFFPAVEYPVAHGTSGTVGDLNGDGWLDLVLTQEQTGSIALLHGDGTGRFGITQVVAAGAGPASAAVGELNGDAKADVVIANRQDATLSVLFGTEGGFEPALVLATPPEPARVVLLDVNGDTRLDAVVATAREALCVYVNTGRGTFAPRVSTAIEAALQALVPGDVDGDGRTDLVLAHRLEDGIVSIVYGRPGGFAPARSQRTGDAPAGMAAGDWNEDGRTDFAVANRGSRSVSVVLAAADRWFEDRRDLASGPGPEAVVAGDWNGDGHLDLAAANRDSSSVSVWLGHGDGSFESRPGVACATGPSALACGDLNRDGVLDLAVASRQAGVVSILTGLGDGAFGLRTDYGSGGGTSAVVIADTDGNGIPDVVTANALANTLTILRNRTGVVPVAVSDPGAEVVPGGVRVTWRWETGDAAPALASVQGAIGPAGPWQDSDAAAVPAALKECFVAGAPPAWVRVVVQTPAGERVASPAVRVQAAHPGGLRLEPVALTVPGAPCVIRYELPAAAHAALDVFDVRGRRVQRLVAGVEPAGAHAVHWDLRDARGAPVARGIYVVRLQSGGQLRTARLLIASRSGGR